MPSSVTTTNTNNQDTKRTTLLSLPAEIRACILEQLLLAAPSPYSNLDIGSDDDPVTVWYMSYSEDLENPQTHGWDCMRKIDTRDSRITAFYRLVLCNKTISYEAASIFYQRLKFGFSGVFTFRTVSFWLKTIGPRNRGHLTNLWFEDDILLYYQSDHGFGSQFAQPLDPMSIDKFFQLLTDISPDQKSSKMVITVFLEDSQFPEMPGVEFDEYNSLPMEIPNLMEKFRALQTTRDIGILYRGCASRDDLKPELLRKMGWEVSIHDTTNITDYTLRFQRLHQSGSTAEL